MKLRLRATTTAALGTAMTLALLTACSDGGSTGAAPDRPSATSSTTAPAPAPAAGGDGGSYPTTEALFGALNAAGVPCEEPQEGDFPGVSQAQSCIFDGSEDVVLLRFATPAERADYVANKSELASAVVGQDWAVETVLPESAQRISDALGGEVLAGASS